MRSGRNISLSRHPSLAELIDLFQMSQHTSQFRIPALLLDPLAMAKPQDAAVIRRQNLIMDEMNFLHNYSSTQFVPYDNILNYLDRMISIGVLPQQLT